MIREKNKQMKEKTRVVFLGGYLVARALIHNLYLAPQHVFSLEAANFCHFCLMETEQCILKEVLQFAIV